MPDMRRSHQTAPASIPDIPVIPDHNSQDKFLVITPGLKIPLQDMQFDYSHASGPGGQHVNTTDSAVQLRFPFSSCTAFTDEIRRRLSTIAKHKINSRGELLISVSQSRSQIQNKKKALQNLKEIVRQALRKPATRKKSAVPAASKKNRLKTKKHQAEKRNLRQTPRMDE